jgi:hypothetical protein
MKKGCLWLVIIGLVISLLALLGSLGGDKSDSNNSKESKYLINDGKYEGRTSCTCCGKTANKLGNLHVSGANCNKRL